MLADFISLKHLLGRIERSIHARSKSIGLMSYLILTGRQIVTPRDVTIPFVCGGYWGFSEFGTYVAGKLAGERLLAESLGLPQAVRYMLCVVQP